MKTPTDRAHIKSKGAGGSMAANNLVPLCRQHHIEQHTCGWSQFVIRHPQLIEPLARKGWALKEEFGILRLKYDTEV